MHVPLRQFATFFLKLRIGAMVENPKVLESV